MNRISLCALALLLCSTMAYAGDGNRGVSISFDSNDSHVHLRPRLNGHDARLAITTRDGSTSLLLMNDMVAVQLTDHDLAQIKPKDDDNFLVPVGDHPIHIICSGRGLPTVVIESGLGESSSEWKTVQDRVAKVTRVCTYDRAGYFGSAPGPFPRTFHQINFELKVALENAHEVGPFLLAGHSFGGPVVRNFAERYPALVAGLVLIDGVHENQQTFYGGAYHRLREGAKGRAIPDPQLTGSKRPTTPAADLQDAEDSQREWATEYFARWFASPQTGLLGSKPLVVLARNSTDLRSTSPDADVARERVLLQASLVGLSDDVIVMFVGFDHDMQKTIPDIVADSVVQVVRAVRTHGRISGAKP
jgi:pimeloyl-ACP methyl ester carboxylesterase